MINSNRLGQYSIRQLEQLSGIKAHTIRIWEQRYGLLIPHRTHTNIRFYDDAQLKKLLNVALLVNHGHKISKLSELADKGIKNLINEQFVTAVQNNSIDSAINSLLLSMIDYDEKSFERIFSDSILRRGFEETITQLIYPFLNRVGIMWGINEINPSQEHFISNLIRQKIIAAINSLTSSAVNDKKFLLFLPEGELHEMGLLIAHYLIKLKDITTIYLGQNVPFRDVQETYAACRPTHVLTFLTNYVSESHNPKRFLDEMVVNFKNSNLLVAGKQELLSEIDIPVQINILKDIESFREIL
jgi:DNA-binding transcriptional MerR regulator